MNAVIQAFIEANKNVTLNERFSNVNGLLPHLLAAIPREDREKYPGSLLHCLDVDRALGLFPPRGIDISEWGLSRTDFPAVMEMPRPMQFKRMEIAFWQALVKRESFHSLRKLVRLGLRVFTHEELETIYYSGVRKAVGNGVESTWRSYDELR